MARTIWEYASALVVLASLTTWMTGMLGLAKSKKGMMFTAVMTVLIGLVPLGGVSAAAAVLSLSPSLSVAGTALWGTLLLMRLKDCGPACQRGVRELALLVSAVSLPVLVSFMVGMGPDMYDTGYGFTFWDMVLGASALIMFVRGSWISLVLMACMLAHATAVMMSGNIFDTLIDGPGFFLSVVILVKLRFTFRQSLPKTQGV